MSGSIMLTVLAHMAFFANLGQDF